MCDVEGVVFRDAKVGNWMFECLDGRVFPVDLEQSKSLYIGHDNNRQVKGVITVSEEVIIQ